MFLPPDLLKWRFSGLFFSEGKDTFQPSKTYTVFEKCHV